MVMYLHAVFSLRMGYILMQTQVLVGLMATDDVNDLCFRVTECQG